MEAEGTEQDIYAWARRSIIKPDRVPWEVYLARGYGETSRDVDKVAFGQSKLIALVGTIRATRMGKPYKIDCRKLVRKAHVMIQDLDRKG